MHYNPLPFPKGTPIPIQFNMYWDLGKEPTVLVNIDNKDGTQTSAPNVTYNITTVDGIVTRIDVTPQPDENNKTIDHLIITIKP